MATKKNQHPLHKVIGDMIQDSELQDCAVIKDPACGGNQNIPLFCSVEKSNETEYCNVDLLILKDNKIRVIVEIEEADVAPTQIFGKFLASALSFYFIHGTRKNVPVGMGDSVSFIQILDVSRLIQDKTAKFGQWKRMEKSIRNIVPVRNSKISDYKIFFGNTNDFAQEDKKREITHYIRRALT